MHYILYINMLNDTTAKHNNYYIQALHRGRCEMAQNNIYTIII